MSNGHLKDSVFAAWALDPGHENAIGHLEVCDECRREAVDFRQAMGALREGLHRTAEGRELSWMRPAKSEDSSLEHGEWRLLPRMVSVATLALILVLVTLAPRVPAPAPQAAASDTADNELLLQIQQDLNRRAPEALAPAEMLFADAGMTTSSAGNMNVNLDKGTEQ